MGKSNTSKMLIGRYECDIDKGAISIPWLDKGQMKAPCFYEIIKYNDKDFIYVGDITTDKRENENAIERSECRLNENGQWILPKAVLDTLGDDECIWFGLGDRCTITSKKRLNETEPDLDKIREALLKLGF